VCAHAGVDDAPSIAVLILRWWEEGLLCPFSLMRLFPMCLQSPFGLPWAVIGFWKLGFPETMGCFRRAFRVGKLNHHSVAAYLNGMGTLIHHCAGAFLVSCPP
jgi:hypothetical protein